MKKINIVLFALISAALFFSQYILNSDYLNKYIKPWHMQPFANEDSLSDYVRENYRMLDNKQLYPKFSDSKKNIVNILVDAWGLSMSDSIVKNDFSVFEKLSHKFIVHNRQMNYNTHVEKIELRNKYENSFFLFGGDSLEYGRKEYIPQIGFSNTLFCQNCPDTVMINKIDSILYMVNSLQKSVFIGLTTRGSREGNQDSLVVSLKSLANLAKKHPESVFIIQGTHRPILGSTKKRKMYYTHWVPAVVINAEEIVK